MKHLGTCTIETKRLILRRFTLADAPAMFRNWCNDPEVTRFLTWPPHGSIAVTESILQQWVNNYDQADYYQWAIVLKELDEPIGSIAVVNTDENLSNFEIGYCIGQTWWHQGYTSEALSAVMTELFERTRCSSIGARHDPRNPYSGAVMRKCGMTQLCVQHGDHNNQGECDAVYYIKSASEHCTSNVCPADGAELVFEDSAFVDFPYELSFDYTSTEHNYFVSGRVPEHLRPMIRHLRIDDAIRIIDSDVFADCINLESVTLHNNLEIREDAFRNCPKLKQLIIPGYHPNTCRFIYNEYDEGGFEDCYRYEDADGCYTYIGEEALRGDREIQSMLAADDPKAYAKAHYYTDFNIIFCSHGIRLNYFAVDDFMRMSIIPVINADVALQTVVSLNCASSNTLP